MPDAFFDKLAKLDKIVFDGPHAHDFTEMILPLLSDDPTNRYFYDKLSDPGWLQVLAENGQFASPPSQGWWPQSNLILRFASDRKTADKMIELILEIETDNEYIHQALTETALKMSQDLAARWAEKESDWLNRQDLLASNLPIELGKLIKYLAESGDDRTAIKLASALLELKPDPEYMQKIKEEEQERQKDNEYFLPYNPEPQAKFDRWEYEEIILGKSIPPLVEAGQLDTFYWLCDLLAAANEYSLRKDEEGSPKDYSYIWRPAIEDNDQNMKHDVRDALIESVRDAAEQLIKQDSDKLVPILDVLNRPGYQKWSIFRRIALYLVRVGPSVESEVVEHYLKNKEIFKDIHFHHEYQLLVRDRFGDLTKPDQDEIIGWVLAGEQDRIEQVKIWYDDKKGREPSPQELDKGVAGWLRDELAQFSEYLHGDLRDRYNAAVQSEGKADHPEFPSYSVSWVGPTSPKTSNELSDWSVQTLLAYLQAWQPKNVSMSDSRDGLADVIAAAVSGQPEKYAEHCDQFHQIHPQLHPKYIRGFIEGFHEAARSDKSFNWVPVLDLCKWVVEQDRAFSPEVLAQEIGDGREEASWAWTLRRIANLLEEGLKQKKNTEISFMHRETVWSILEVLANDPDPSLQDEDRFMEPIDPATISINTVRGQAMHSVMHFIMWVRKHLGQMEEVGEKPVLDFSIMPKVRLLLERRLNHKIEKTLTIQSVYGRWFPWLIAWDAKWSNNYKRKIFPESPTLDNYWRTAWGTYIVFNSPYDNVFRALKRDYGKALRRLDTIQVELAGAGSVDESLAEHLMTFYWRGLIKMRSGSLISQFFDVAPPELRGHAIAFMGESLANTDASIHDDIMPRFYDLWKWRLRLAEQAVNKKAYEPEIRAFGKWFGTQKLGPIEWALDQVLRVLELMKRIDADEAMVKYLAALAEKYPMKVIDCFRLMVLNETDRYNIWLWKEHGKRLLSTIIAGTNLGARGQAIELVHRLGAMGHQEFREILPD